MTYDQAMEQYGCDKPDTRFDMQLQNVTELFRSPNTTDALAAYAIVVPIDPKHKYPSGLKEVLTKIAADSSSKLEVVRVNRVRINLYRVDKNLIINTKQTIKLCKMNQPRTAYIP